MLFLLLLPSFVLTLHEWVKYIPLPGTILWACSGRSIEICCDTVLWSIWYSHNQDLPQNHEWNVNARQPHVEAELGSYTYLWDQSPIYLTPIGCVELLGNPGEGHILSTGHQWLYPCEYDHIMHFEEVLGRRRRVTYTKGTCRPIRHDSLKDVLRKAERNCLRMISKGLHKAFRLTSYAANAIPRQDRRTIVPVPQLSLTSLDAEEAYPVRLKTTWSYELEVSADDLVEGHTYVGCAEGRDDMDVIMDFAAV